MRLLFWTLFLFAIWMAITMSLNPQELISGFFISLILSYIYTKKYDTDYSFRIRPLIYLNYLIVFLKNLVLSNIDVAKRVIDPKLPINPGIVAIKTDLLRDYKKLALANSITLTPGTITMDVRDDILFIHWLDVKTEDLKEASEEIAGEFEEALKDL